jgi:tRNA nucleotidyltransferase (CCA-adding enzyme)
MTDIETIKTCVLSRIKPSEDEKIRLENLAKSIISRINILGESEGIDIRGILVGSSARGTWISGEHDLDIFIMFPPDQERQYLEEKGLYVARKIAMQGESFEERYAEHPYIHAIFDGFEVDLVPAFNVKSGAEIRSAVDRTPFHNTYVSSRIQGSEDEVLLLKQFQKGIGVYGSELKTRGFSGFLAELLVIHYGLFENVLKAACDWKAGTSIDIENHGTLIHRDPLVMIDPTDPSRNVAAALSLDNMCVFIDKSCEFLENPDEKYFKVQIPKPLGDDEFRKIINERGSSLLAIVFKVPDIVEDVLFPQLHKLEDSVCEMLEKYDFLIFNSAVWADENAIVLLELESANLPLVKKHVGPNVWAKDFALSFKEKYNNSRTFSNIFIQNGRYMVEIPRKYSIARKLIESEILKCGLGKHLALSIKKEFHVIENEELLNIRNEEWRKFLRGFFEK